MKNIMKTKFMNKIIGWKKQIFCTLEYIISDNALGGDSAQICMEKEAEDKFVPVGYVRQMELYWKIHTFTIVFIFLLQEV